MPTNVAQRSFQSGEIAPSLYGRSDIELYAKGLRTLRNATVKRTGGIQSRPGSTYIYGTKSNQLSRLVPIVFDDADAFVAEFGLNYLRLFKNGAPITIASSGNWTTATAYTVGTVVTSTNGTALAAYLCIAAHTAGASTEPTIGASWQTVWYELTEQAPGNVGAGPWIYELPTPYNATEIYELQAKGFQLNTLTVVHPNYAPRALVRGSADNQWTFDTVSFGVIAGLDIPTGLTLTVDAAPAWVTATAYVLNDVRSNGGVVYRCILGHTSSATDEPGVGANWTTYWAIKGTGGDDAGFWYVVTSVNANGDESIASTPLKTDSSQNPLSPTFRAVRIQWSSATGAVEYRVYRSLTSSLGYRRISATSGLSVYDSDETDAAYLSDEGPPVSPTLFASSGNYPSALGAYQQRLLLGGTINKPDVVYGSVVGQPYNFNARFPTIDSDAVEWRQVGPRLNRVRHFIEMAQRLVQFSSIGETIIQGDADAVLVPGAVNPRQVSEWGAARVPEPLLVGDTALFVQARGTQIRDLFAVEASLMGGSELSITASHLFDGYTITSWCFQQTPDPIVWMTRSDGLLISLTYQRQQGVFAWARHDLRTSQGQGKYLSVACIPEGGRDTVYAAIEYVRTGPTTTRNIVRFVDRTVANPVCVDAAVVYSGTATSTVTGLGHLNGESVAVVVNGTTVLASPFNTATPATFTVSAGSITLPASYTDIVIGLPFVTDVQTLDIDSPEATIKERGIMIGGVMAWVENTGKFWASPKAPLSTDNTNAIFEVVEPKDEDWNVQARATGLVKGAVLSSWNNTGRVFIRNVDPQPMSLLAVIPRGHIAGR